MKEFKLVVMYDNRVITIPFKNIKDLDEFTVNYHNFWELGKMIDKIFNLKIKNVSVLKIYINKIEQKNNGNNYVEYLPVKYTYNDFDKDMVRDNYINYFIQDRKRFDEAPIGLKMVIENYLKKYDKNNLNDNDIYKIVNLYLDNNYERYRIAYFTLVNNGYQIKNNIKRDRSTINNKTKSYSTNDEYANYLLESVKLGRLEQDEVMDILSGYSLDELKNMFPNDNFFDGLGNTNDEQRIYDEALTLSALAGMSISDLSRLVDRYQNEYNKGYRK